jgi:hypothetical protein
LGDALRKLDQFSRGSEHFSNDLGDQCFSQTLRHLAHGPSSRFIGSAPGTAKRSVNRSLADLLKKHRMRPCACPIRFNALPVRLSSANFTSGDLERKEILTKLNQYPHSSDSQSFQ